MINKGTCQKCGRKILATVHDRCMYCGEPLPDEQKFSEQEKQAVLKSQELAAKRPARRGKGKGEVDMAWLLDPGSFDVDSGGDS